MRGVGREGSLSFRRFAEFDRLARFGRLAELNLVAQALRNEKIGIQRQRVLDGFECRGAITFLQLCAC